MKETNIQVKAQEIIEAKDIAVNAAEAAKKYLAEVCIIAQQKYQKITKKQKERNWFHYINQLEN